MNFSRLGWKQGALLGVLVLVLLAGILVFGSLLERSFNDGRGPRTMMWNSSLSESTTPMMGGWANDLQRGGGMMKGVAPRGMMAPAALPSGGTSIPTTTNVPERKTVTTASLELRAQDMDWTVNAIKEATTQAGGIVDSLSVSQPRNGIRTGWILVRVPKDKFQEVFDNLKKTAKVVVNQTISGTDVTLPYADLTARLSNKQAEEVSLQALLKQSTKVSDTIDITNRLSEVRSEIEGLQAQKAALDQQTDMASITLSIEEDPRVTTDPNAFRGGNVFKTAINMLWQALVGIGSGLVIFLIAALPIILIFALVLWVIYFFTKKGLRRFFDR